MTKKQGIAAGLVFAVLLGIVIFVICTKNNAPRKYVDGFANGEYATIPLEATVTGDAVDLSETPIMEE